MVPESLIVSITVMQVRFALDNIICRVSGGRIPRIYQKKC